jgi:hypothetical protein
MEFPGNRFEHDGPAEVTTETKRTPVPRVTVREASFDDYGQIASLESQYGLETRTFAEWQHLWSDNPAYVQVRGPWPMGWVLENETGRIVGYFGNIPLLYLLGRRELLAAAGHAWVVDSRYRSYSYQLVARYFNQKNVDLYLNTSANLASSKTFQAFHASKVPVGNWDQAPFWIANYPGFVRSFLTKKAIPLVRPLSLGLSLPLYLRDRLFGKGRCGGRIHFDVEACQEFDDRFDTFWEALKQRNLRRLLGVRTREVLAWHYKYGLLQGKTWVVTATDASGLAGYAVFSRQDVPKIMLRRMWLVDFKSLDGTFAPLAPMVDWALERCRKEGIHMLEVIGVSAERGGAILKSAPHQQKLPAWLYFYKTKDKSLEERLRDPEVWDPSPYDGDLSL